MRWDESRSLKGVANEGGLSGILRHSCLGITTPGSGARKGTATPGNRARETGERCTDPKGNRGGGCTEQWGNPAESLRIPARNSCSHNPALKTTRAVHALL